MSRTLSPANAAGRWAVVGVVLLLTAAGTMAAGRRTVDPVSGPPVAADQSPVAPPGRVKPVAVRSAPVALRIPAIGVAVSVTSLALNADGTVQVPTDYALAGWFRLGPSPGQLGSAVILGHVDSYRGPAVFFRLRLLKPGDRVEVSSADGTVNTFVVRAVETYPKKLFPARLVYGSHGYSALQLVTCGGEFDSRTRSYASNVVAYTALAGTTAAAAAGAPRAAPIPGRPAR